MSVAWAVTVCIFSPTSFVCLAAFPAISQNSCEIFVFEELTVFVVVVLLFILRHSSSGLLTFDPKLTKLVAVATCETLTWVITRIDAMKRKRKDTKRDRNAVRKKSPP